MNDLVDLDKSNAVATPIPNDLVLDHSKYSSELNDLEISEEQKRELLETMWGIMRLFVEFGYSVDVSGRAVMDVFNQAASLEGYGGSS